MMQTHSDSVAFPPQPHGIPCLGEQKKSKCEDFPSDWQKIKSSKTQVTGPKLGKLRPVACKWVGAVGADVLVLALSLHYN